MRIIPINLKKIISHLLLLSLANCFTVYTKDETVYEKEKLRTEDRKEERDVYVLTHSLNSKGLYLFLDAYRVEEKSKIDFIREKYKENKDFKIDEHTGKGGNPCSGDGCIAVLAIYLTIMILDLGTVPIRLISLPQERIRKEIRKDSSTKIAIIPTNDIAFALLDRYPPKEYLFKNNELFISMKDLELDSFTVKKFPYKLTNSIKLTNMNNRNIFLKGEFNFSEQANNDKEIKSIIQKNNENKNTAKCKIKYPEITKEKLLPYEMSNLFHKHCGVEPPPIWENWSYTDCVEKIRECYNITKQVE